MNGIRRPGRILELRQRDFPLSILSNPLPLGDHHLGFEILEILHQHHICPATGGDHRSEEHTSELQSPYVISYAVFCLKKKTNPTNWACRMRTASRGHSPARRRRP